MIAIFLWYLDSKKYRHLDDIVLFDIAGIVSVVSIAQP